MNVGKIYTIRLVGNPHMAMDPLPLDFNSPCMKNKCCTYNHARSVVCKNE